MGCRRCAHVYDSGLGIAPEEMSTPFSASTLLLRGVGEYASLSCTEPWRCIGHVEVSRPPAGVRGGAILGNPRPFAIRFWSTCGCRGAGKAALGQEDSWFGVAVMLSGSAVHHPSAAAMPSSTSERAVVYIVDDDASMRGALEGLFESVGLDTRTYSAAGEFLASRLVDKPGCIVIDVRLPDMNGLDFHAQLIQSGVRLPVVMITGYGDIPMTVRAMKRGAVDFLSKPLHDQDMLDAVMAAVE